MHTAKNTLSEFKDFISKGNVIDLAVGVIIGGAFGKIVTSLVDDILMPIVGIILGGVHFESLSIKIGEASIAYGAFIQSIVDFLIIAASIFIFVKCIKNITKNTAPAPMAVENKKLEQKETQEIVVLKEIRDALKNK